MKLSQLLIAIVLFTSPIFAQDDRSGGGADRDEIPFAVIEQAPAFPGCSGSAANLKSCTSQKIQEYVAQNFDLTKIQNTDLKPGKYQIAVFFKVDKSGKVSNIQASSTNETVKEEAIRVVSSFPKMKPGRHRGKKVSVLYSLPIKFEIAR